MTESRIQVGMSQDYLETILGASETYTGAWVRVPDGLMVTCKSDTAGALYFDFSPNWRQV